MTLKKLIEIGKQKAILVAQKSDHRCMHGCVAVAIRGPYKGTVISEGYNQKPGLYGLRQRKGGREERSSIQSSRRNRLLSEGSKKITSRLYFYSSSYQPYARFGFI